MKLILIFIFGWLSVLFSGSTSVAEPAEVNPQDVVWAKDIDVEKFWLMYTSSKGGLTWGRSADYPEYVKIKEGDTFMVEVEQGPCLMEIFHNRWRRANDVRRWDDSINAYGGCPYVFD